MCRASAEKEKSSFVIHNILGKKSHFLTESAGNKMHKHHPKVDCKTDAVPSHLIDEVGGGCSLLCFWLLSQATKDGGANGIGPHCWSLTL